MALRKLITVPLTLVVIGLALLVILVIAVLAVVCALLAWPVLALFDQPGSVNFCTTILTNEQEMAHPCWSCGGECYCHGDIDDCVVSLTPGNCDGCGCDGEDGRWDDNEGDDAWLCGCGNYEESGLHCSVCGAEPPWGCPCSACGEPDYNGDEDFFW